MRLILSVLVVFGAAGSASLAEPVRGAVAAAELFETTGIGLQLSRDLGDKERATIKAMIPLIEQQTGTKAKFYGTLAYAPDEGLISEALQGAFNFHSVEAADRAALAACRAAKKASSSGCKIAARILPPGYERRAFSLSHDATRGFFERYIPATGRKYLAVSEATGAWAMAPSSDGAMRTCAQDSKSANDCSIVIGD